MPRAASRRRALLLSLRSSICRSVTGKMEMDVEGVSLSLGAIPAPQGLEKACQRPSWPRPSFASPPLPTQHPAPDEPLGSARRRKRTATIRRDHSGDRGELVGPRVGAVTPL